MSEQQIRRMLLAIIDEIDHDAYKFYVPETSEDPEAAEESMQDLIQIVLQHLESGD